METKIYPTINNEEYLEHYGVLGMKWGVRKAETKARNARRTSNIAEKIADSATRSSYEKAKKRSQEASRTRKRSSKIKAGLSAKKAQATRSLANATKNKLNKRASNKEELAANRKATLFKETNDSIARGKTMKSYGYNRTGTNVLIGKSILRQAAGLSLNELGKEVSKRASKSTNSILNTTGNIAQQYFNSPISTFVVTAANAKMTYDDFSINRDIKNYEYYKKRS